jgi:UDP-N-acetyl-2-amino-2-deoxyglucuronate dehydrogenase
LGTKKIRTAVVGCGKVGHTHARSLQSLPDSEFVAVCDVSADRTEAYRKEYNVKAYTDFRKMVLDEGIEMVSVCTPHPLHALFIAQAADLGVHVLTEKPLASDLQDCDRAIEACHTKRVKLGMISQRRLYPPIIRMRNAIQEGKIGKPIIGFMIVMGWRSKEYYEMDNWRGKWQTEGGGVMVNQTIHQLDLLQWLLGPIDELYGYWDNFNHPTIEVEDTAVAVMRFKNGAVGQFFVSNSQKPGFYGKIHVHGSNGASVGAQVEGGSPFIAGVTSKVDPPLNDIWTIPGEEQLLPQWNDEDRQFASQHDVMTHFHHLQIEDFIKSILEDREPMVTGEEARKSVEIFTAVYRSQRDRIPIKFPLKAENNRSDFDGRLIYLPFCSRGIKK